MNAMTRPMSLEELIQDSVLKHWQGVDGVAEALDMVPASVYAMISPSPIKRHAKLGLYQWVKIVRHTRDFRSLFKVAQDLDHVCVPIPQDGFDQPRNMLLFIADITRETSEAVTTLAEAMSHDSPGGRAITAEERQKIKQEAYEAMQALASLWSHMQEG